jgi:hypothetical protein
VKKVVTIFSRSAAYATGNGFESRNLFMYDIFSALAAADISGWTLVSSSLPTPSTTEYQSVNCVFDLDGFRVKFYTSINYTSSVHAKVYCEIQKLDGTTLMSVSSTYSPIICYASSNECYGDISIDERIVANKCHLVTITSSHYSLPVMFGKIFLTNKETNAPDFILINEFSDNSGVLKSYGNTQYKLQSLGMFKKNDGSYLTISARVFNLANIYVGDLIDCKLGGGFSAGFYLLGGDTYYVTYSSTSTSSSQASLMIKVS